MTTNEWITFKTANSAGRPTKRERNSVQWQVNANGEIRIILMDGTIKAVKPSLSGGHQGSRYLCLSTNDFKYVHRIVATAFCPNPEGLRTVDHIDGNKLNNKASNLQWVSHKRNLQLFWERKGK